MGLDPLTQIAISVAIAIGSAAYQQSQIRRMRRKMRRALEDRAGVTIRVTPSGQEVPVCYGATGAPGIQVYAQTSATLPASPGDGAKFGTLGHADNGSELNKTRKFRSYLLTQNVFCAAGIEAVDDLHVDDKPWRDGKISPIVAHAIRQGTAEPAATAFTSERTADDVFDGLTYATGVYKYDIDDPLFYGPPYLFAFLRGRRVPALTHPTDTSWGVGNKAYSANAVRCFYDYLTSPDYGPGLTAFDIDLRSFYAAQEIAGQVMQGPRTAIYNKAIPAEVREWLGAGPSIRTYGDYFRLGGFSGPNDVGLSDWHSGPPPEVVRYAAHGNVPTTRNWPDAIDQFLEVMPGAQFFRGYDGKYKLKLPDVSRSATAQSVMTIDESVLVGHIRTTWPDSSVKLNGMTGTFADVEKDLASEALTWPPAGSNAETIFDGQDGGVQLRDSVRLELTNNAYHAADILSSEILISRRRLYRCKMRPSGFLLEPGDIVRLRDEQMEVADFGMVLQVLVGQDLSIEIECREFNVGDYAWISTDKVANAQRLSWDYSAGEAGAIRVSLYTDILPRSVSVEWDDVTGRHAATTFYEVEMAEFGAAPQDSADREWRRVYGGPVSTRQYLQVIGENERWYQFRVRPHDARGLPGEWLVSSVLHVEEADLTHLRGADGVDGLGPEYIFTSSPTAAAISGSANLPDPDWNFDASGLADGLTRGDYKYYDGTPADISLARPYMIRFRRAVPGQPAQDEEIGQVEWVQERAVRAQGLDGKSVEFVYRRTATKAKPANIVTSAAQRDVDDFVPTGATDDPVGPTRALPYEWISARTRGTGSARWNEFRPWAVWSVFANGIKSIERAADGTVTISFVDGTTDTFTLRDTADVKALANGDIRVTYSDGTSIDIPHGRGIHDVSRTGTTVRVEYDTFDDQGNREYDTFTILDGADGAVGPRGVGIKSASRNSRTGVVTLVFTDGTSDTFTVPDGANGTTLTGTAFQPDGDLRLTWSDGTSVDIPPGKVGADGRGIKSVDRNDTTGVITVTYDDNTKDTFTILDGADGAVGPRGVGIKSATRNTRTGVVTLVFTDGTSDTFTVSDGANGTTLTGTAFQSDGDLRLTWSDGTSVDIPPGKVGADGNGIKSVRRRGDTVTVTYDDNTTDTFTVQDGEDGHGLTGKTKKSGGRSTTTFTEAAGTGSSSDPIVVDDGADPSAADIRAAVGTWLNAVRTAPGGAPIAPTTTTSGAKWSSAYQVEHVSRQSDRVLIPGGGGAYGLRLRMHVAGLYFYKNPSGTSDPVLFFTQRYGSLGV